MKAIKKVITPHSDEWYQTRLARFTSSCVHKLMGDARAKDEVFSKTGLSYIYEKVAETISGVLPEKFTSAATDFGSAYEAEAISEFQLATRQTVELGVVYELDERFAGSPDGVTATHILEVKCPYNPGNHIENTLIRDSASLKIIRPEYYWQLIANMWLADLDRGYFISFDPRQQALCRIHIVEILMNDEDKAKLEERVEMAWQYKERMILNLAAVA